MIDIHCHTIASSHAYSSLTECIHAAIDKNLELIAITDHAPAMLGGADEFYFLNTKILPRKVKTLNIMYGAEANIINHDGELDLPEYVLKGLDIVIASLHPPCIEPKDDNTDAIVNVMQNKYVNVIGHLGDARFPIDVEKVVYAAKKTSTLIEINNSSLNPGHIRYSGDGPIKLIIDQCKKNHVPVIMGSDAHYHTDIGNLEHAMRLLNDFPHELIMNHSTSALYNIIAQKRKLL